MSLYNHHRNMNQSEVFVLLKSGACVRVSTAHGLLDVAVMLPPTFNMTYKVGVLDSHLFVFIACLE